MREAGTPKGSMPGVPSTPNRMNAGCEAGGRHTGLVPVGSTLGRWILGATQPR
jgi:hypothetical protein